MESGNGSQYLYLYTTNKKINNPMPIEMKVGYNSICVDPHEELAPID